MLRAFGFFGFFAGVTAATALAQNPVDVPLPAPRMDGGKPLMQVLRDRRSTREYSDRALALQTISDLLWAAAGTNRPTEHKRTAPSARNWQEIEVYAVTKDGAYLYDAEANLLRAVISGDLRRRTGTQDFVGIAPLDLVYVADVSKMKDVRPGDEPLYNGADAAFISENVYLFCASEGLATVVRGSVDRAALATALKLPETRKVVFAQTVGYPKEEAGK